MIVAISPGKVILLGEHGVVYGKPCLSMAISLKVAVNIEKNKEFTVNSLPLDERRHVYIKKAINKIWDGEPISITTFSQIPSASGLGSSAAITTACVAALLAMKGKFNLEDVAKKSFEVEYEVQGGASPNDTSVCTYGNAILTWEKKMPGYLWGTAKDGREWFVYPVKVHDMKVVIGHTGIKSKTPLLIKKIRKFVEYYSFGRELINEMESLVIEGKEALENRDFVKLGSIMNENHKILHTLGASSKEIEKLRLAALKAGAYGAKLTGAGGGGSIIAIGDNPEKIAEAIEKKRGKVYIVSTAKEGVKILK
ncbi:MAG: mevalonate kinase [Thermoplasmata archaeon]|nr:MAG: mevalonate kinase [Thermoplasmata archaeon]